MWNVLFDVLLRLVQLQFLYPIHDHAVETIRGGAKPRHTYWSENKTKKIEICVYLSVWCWLTISCTFLWLLNEKRTGLSCVQDVTVALCTTTIFSHSSLSPPVPSHLFISVCVCVCLGSWARATHSMRAFSYAMPIFHLYWARAWARAQAQFNSIIVVVGVLLQANFILFCRWFVAFVCIIFRLLIMDAWFCVSYV